MESALFGAGCFWGVEHNFRKLKGVQNVVSGYSGGMSSNPSYEQVCSGKTGHAEVVKVDYDPSQISYDQLLNAFWEMHDPTTWHRQGPDIGAQYRSVIFYLDESQKHAAQNSLEKLEQSKKWNHPIVTEVLPASEFFKAEDYHQQYLKKRGDYTH